MEFNHRTGIALGENLLTFSGLEWQVNRVDFGKILYHPHFLSKYIREGKFYPYHMSVGLIAACNHRCRWCYIDFAKSNLQIDSEVLLNTLRQARRSWALKAVTIVGMGEPTLYPDFCRVIEEMLTIGLEIGLFTNGSRLRGRIADALMGATFVRISLDAATAATHQLCHRSEDYQSIIDNIRSFVQLKRRLKRTLPTIGIQFATSDLNAHEIIPMARMASELGVDYLAYKPVYKNKRNPDHAENGLTLAEAECLINQARQFESSVFQIHGKLQQFEDVLGKGSRPYSECLAHSVSPYIEEDGSIVFCGNLYPDSMIGNIYESNIEEIWYGPRHVELTRTLDLSKCIKGCKYHRLNLLLQSLTKPDPELHINFI